MKLTLILAAVLIVHATPPVPREAPEKYSADSKKGDKAAQDHQPPTTDIPIANPEKSPNAADNAEQTAKKKENENAPVTVNPVNVNKDIWDKVYITASIIIALATAGLAITALIQASAAKESADIAMNSQRSWIIEIGVKGPQMVSDWVKTAICKFKVIGASPARIQEASFTFKVVPGRPVEGENSRHPVMEPDLPDTPAYEHLYNIREAPDVSGVLAPGREFGIEVWLEGMFFSPEQIEAINKSEQFACIYGFIKYRDAFSKSKTREMRFCYVYSVWQNAVGKTTHPSEFLHGGPPQYNEST